MKGSVWTAVPKRVTKCSMLIQIQVLHPLKVETRGESIWPRLVVENLVDVIHHGYWCRCIEVRCRVNRDKRRWNLTWLPANFRIRTARLLAIRYRTSKLTLTLNISLPTHSAAVHHETDKNERLVAKVKTHQQEEEINLRKSRG